MNPPTQLRLRLAGRPRKLGTILIFMRGAPHSERRSSRSLLVSLNRLRRKRAEDLRINATQLWLDLNAEPAPRPTDERS